MVSMLIKHPKSELPCLKQEPVSQSVVRVKEAMAQAASCCLLLAQEQELGARDSWVHTGQQVGGSPTCHRTTSKACTVSL